MSAFRSLAFKILMNGLNVVTGILLVRVMSVEDFGRYSYVMGVIGIAAVFTSLGLDQYFIREMSREPEAARLHLKRFLGAQIILSSVVSLLLLAITRGHHDPVERRGLLLVCGGLLTSVLVNPMTAIQFARGRNDLVSLEMLVQTVFQFALTLIGWKSQATLTYYFCIPLATALLRSVHTLWVNGRRGDVVAPGVRLSQFSGVLLAGLPFTLMVTANILYSKVDILLFARFQGERVVGLYSVAGKLAYILIFIPYTLCEGLYPMFSRFFGTEIARCRELLSQYMFYGLLVTLPIAVGGTIESKHLIAALFGERYVDVSLPMSIYLFVPVCVSLYAGANYFLAAAHRVWWLVKVSFTFLLINAAVNFYVVTHFAPGAAMTASALATLATESFVAMTSLFTCRRMGMPSFPARRIARLGVPLMGLAASLYIPIPSVFCRIAVAATGYAALAWLTNAVDSLEKAKIVETFTNLFPARATPPKNEPSKI